MHTLWQHKSKQIIVIISIFWTHYTVKDFKSYCFIVYYIQWDKNCGKCGICGDPYPDPEPRNHEDNGLYDNGYIVRTYREGQLIDVEVNFFP